jgi:hypothetical protein
MKRGRIFLFFKRFLEGWARSVTSHPLLVLLVVFPITATTLIYAISHFRIDTEFSAMISDTLPYRKSEKEFQQAFPQFIDTIVVVIDAQTPETARSWAGELIRHLKKERDLFQRISWPGGDDFFEKNGLLYLSAEEIEELADRLAKAQPLLGMISRDLSLRGLFSTLEEILSAEVDEETRKGLSPFFDRLREAFQSAAANESYDLSWQELVLGEKAVRGMQHELIILQPVPGKEGSALQALHRLRENLKIPGMRLTGDVVLDEENLAVARASLGVTTLISFFLVAFALLLGLGSWSLVFASLATLLVGLIGTLGFAIAFIGRLNPVSVAFGVLFIGLGIDYSIQFCLRYLEIEASGLKRGEAVCTAGVKLGKSLWLCTLTTAIGFYSFLPTAYTGVSELGLISGTGMFINFFTTLTVLPALLVLMPLKKGKTRKFLTSTSLHQWPYKHPRSIRMGALVAAIGSILFLPKVHFDYNPLNLYDPSSEAVSTLKELFRDERISPWTISVLTGSREEAEGTAARLRNLREVKEVITLPDFVPEDQSEKMRIITGLSLLMESGLEGPKPELLTYEQKVQSLRRFKTALRSFLSRSDQKNDAGPEMRLYHALEKFEKVVDPKTVERLERSLLSGLFPLLRQLEASLQAHPFGEKELPQDLRAQYTTPDGRYRVEVIPRENISDIKALDRFVDAVTAVAPNATDTPATIREAGKAVAHSFLQAILYALSAITLSLLIELRSIRYTLLVLLPLGLSMLLIGAASVILKIPFNFANVIVVPLLLGFGVDTGIYFVYRFRSDLPQSGNILETSTARAIFFSTLVTILGFSSLSFSSHRGLASMGNLLNLCMAFLAVTTLVLLPTFLNALRGRTERTH